MLRQLTHASDAQKAAMQPRGFLVMASDAPQSVSQCQRVAEGIYSVSATPAQIEQMLQADPGVVFVEMQREQRPLLNNARRAAKVDEALAAVDEFTATYDGSGVVVALMDVGLDPNHRTFFDADGQRRISRVWHFTSWDGSCDTYEGDEIADFTTDSQSQSHGTHVLGIMAGSYDGPGRYTVIKGTSMNQRAEVVDGPLPYRGVASGAEIVAGCGSLYDSNIVTTIANAVEYAQSVGKPLVVNLSLGSSQGPHDGTDLLTSAINSYGSDAVICMSAGNEGNTKASLVHIFAPDETELKTFVTKTSFPSGVDVWSSDDSPLDIAWVAYDTQAGDIVAELTPDQEPSEEWKQYFSGDIGIYHEVNPLNNRANAYCYTSAQARSSHYRLGLRVRGAEGQRVCFYLNPDDGCSFADNNTEGWTDGSSEGSISNIACGNSSIAIGSFATRINWANLNGRIFKGASSSSTGGISPFSSWGNMPDGTTLPHVCAPGEALISAASAHYISRSNPDATVAATAPGIERDTDYYMSMQGTSMSSPLAAGIVALWLQADPTLTRDGVLDVIRETSTLKGIFMSARPRWGAGKIDAFEGLRYILGTNSIAGVTADGESAMRVTQADGRLSVAVAGAPRLELRLHDASGRLAASASVQADEASVDVGFLQPGVYVLTATSPDASTSRRIMLRN